MFRQVKTSTGDGLYFYSERDHKKGELYKYHFATQQIERLTNNDFSEYSAVWSPDETQIAFVSNMDGDDDLYVVDVDGENLK